MKRNIVFPLLLILALLLCGCGRLEKITVSTPEPTTAPTAEPAPGTVPTAEPSLTPAPTPSAKPISPEVLALLDKNESVRGEISDHKWMVGRLVIPSAGIDVPLYEWGEEPAGETDAGKIEEYVRQLVVDNEDSALIYNDGLGYTIADHSNQDFASLSEVQIGDPAYILKGDCVVSLRCDLVTDGVNTGYGVTDNDGHYIHENEDYFCYTCLENWTHVRIVGFALTDEDFIEEEKTDGIETADASENRGVVVTSSLPADGAAVNNNGVVTTSSLPAEGVPAGTSGAPASTDTVPAQAAPTPTPTPTPAPAETRAPTPVQTAQPVQEPVYIPDLPDIYSDNYNSAQSSSGSGLLYEG